MNQNERTLNIQRMEQSWEECREALGISHAQSFEVAKVPAAPSFLHLEYDNLFKFLNTFNLSLELLDQRQVCLDTLARQFRGEIAFSQNALGNRGSRPEIILKLGHHLSSDDFEDVLSSFQLSKTLLTQAKTYLSAEIVNLLSDKICDHKAGYLWIKPLAAENCRECLGQFKGNAKTLPHFINHQINSIERNFHYQIESSNHRKTVFSCNTNQRSRDYFGKNIENRAWLLNIQYFLQAYFDNRVEITLLNSTLGGADCNRFEVSFD